MSHRLKQRGLAHLVLAAAPDCRTLAKRTLGRPAIPVSNWAVRLPDFPFPHADPDGFATTREIVDFIAAYADFIGGADPLRPVSVTALRCRDGGSGFVAEHSRTDRSLTNVVVATGP